MSIYSIEYVIKYIINIILTNHEWYFKEQVKVLIAIAEKLGFIVQYDEKTGDISMKVDDTNLRPEKAKMDAKELAEAINPYIYSTINAAISTNPA